MISSCSVKVLIFKKISYQKARHIHIAAIHASFKNILTYFDRLEQVLSYIVGSIIS